MSSQIFKSDIPKEILFTLLQDICNKNENENYYILNKTSYKKGMFLNLFEPFCEDILKYYHKSKKFYVTRKLTYTSFLTIIRQICRNINISYTSKIQHCKCSYDIVYHINFE